jgi:hypothetical protein
MKHNKKRNSGILYNILIKEYAKASIENEEKSAVVLNLIKENFSRTSPLGQELRLYKELMSLSGKKEITKRVVEKVLMNVKYERSLIDSTLLEEKKTNLINTINKTFGQEVWEHYINEYKVYAQVYQILLPDQKTSMADRILAEESFIEDTLKNEKVPEVEGVPASSLVKHMVKGFAQYKDKLHEEQFALLTKYMDAPKDGGILFMAYLTEEMDRIDTVLKEALRTASIDDSVKLREALSALKSFKERSVEEQDIEKILVFQDLARTVADDN